MILPFMPDAVRVPPDLSQFMNSGGNTKHYASVMPEKKALYRQLN